MKTLKNIIAIVFRFLLGVLMFFGLVTITTIVARVVWETIKAVWYIL